MELTFNVTPKEYQEYLKYASARLVKLGKSGWMVPVLNFSMWLIIAFTSTILFKYLTQKTNIDTNLILYGVILLVISGLIYLLSSYLKYNTLLKNYCSENGLLTGETTITLEEKTIAVHSQYFRAQYYWPTIQDVTQSKNLICIFYDISLAQVIPKRVFDDPEHLRDFVSFIEAKRSMKKSV